jgi:8-amino-7-oxononanoate synthase
LRVLQPRSGIDFSSNDYLGLANDPAIAQAVGQAVARGVPVGAGGSRLLRGNAPEHAQLEAQAAAFFGAEAALYLANGFAGNVALIAALPRPGDLIVADALIHASVHDGLVHSRADHVFAQHNDAQAFADAIMAWRNAGGTGRPWIVAETLYSMDGDLAPVDALAAVAAQHDAMLILDEAHATGVFGQDGRGVAAHLAGAENLITLHTCGKALGVEGALVCGSRVLIDILINKARQFVFSTAPSPLMAIAVGAALEQISGVRGNALRSDLAALRKFAGDALCGPLGLPSPASQIVPVILGDDKRTMQVAGALQQAGFDVRGIRPPTVPAGTGRLRVSITRNVRPDDIQQLASLLVPMVNKDMAA